MYYMGLDTATTTGIAIYNTDNNIALVTLKKGSPIEQFIYIDVIVKTMFKFGRGHIDFTQIKFVFEELHNFRNAKTTRSLCERYGFLKYSLLKNSCQVSEIPPKMARSLLGLAGKKETFDFFSARYVGSMFSSDHADALAVALCQAHVDGFAIDLDTLRIRTLDL